MSNNTSRKFILASIFFIATSQSFCQSVNSSFREAEDTKCAYWSYIYYEAPGFASKNSSGAWSGICVDIMSEFRKYVKDKYDIQITISDSVEYTDFTQFLDVIEKSNNGTFGLSSTTITEERKEEFSFSPPYITNVSMMLSNTVVPTLIDISNISEKFEGMTAVTVKNTTNEKRILDIKKSYFPNLQIEYVSSFEDAMSAVISDNTKFTNVDFTYYFEAIQNRKPIKRHPAGDDQTEHFGIIMSKTNDWSPVLEEFLNSGFLESDEYQAIISKNLGEYAMRYFETLR